MEGTNVTCHNVTMSQKRGESTGTKAVLRYRFADILAQVIFCLSPLNISKVYSNTYIYKEKSGLYT